MKHKWLIFLCFLLVSAVVGVIWWESMQNGVASHAESRRVLAFVLCVGDAQSLSTPTGTDHREVQDG